MRAGVSSGTLAVVLGLAAGAASCGGGGERAVLPAVSGPIALGVRAVQPDTSLPGGMVKALGDARARNQAVLSAPASGKIAKIIADVGERVRQGQLLVQLDTSDAVLGVEQARAARAMAEAGIKAANREFERIKLMRASEGAPAAAVDRAMTAVEQATAGLAQAEAAVRMAEDHLSDLSMRAPFDGVVTQRFKSVGETVAMMPPTPVVTVVDVEHVEVRLPVSETVVSGIKQGALLKGKLSPAGTAFDAKVRTVGSVVDPINRTVEVLLDVVASDGVVVRPGSIVEIDLAAAAELAGMFIPSQAVLLEGDKAFVWVVKGDVAERRDVRIERMSPGVVRVVAGLALQDLVVVDGAGGLRAGVKVRVAS